MRQVFIKTVSALQAASGTAGDARFNDLSNGELGFWTLDGANGGQWFAGRLFQTDLASVDATVDTSDAGAASDPVENLTTFTGGQFLQSRIQVAQGYGSGNPIATPIIDTRNIVRISAAGYQATARHEVKITPNAGDIGSDELNLKIIVRKQPTGYLDYVNNEGVIADLSGGNYQFPLHVFNTTNHKVINISVDAGTDVAGTCDNIVTAISGNTTLNSMFTTNDDATHVDLVARHAGVVFELILENITDDRYTNGVVVAAYDPGVGNDWQARADELKARATYGHYNRMYFPNTITDFVSNGDTFDRYEITYRIDGDRNVVKGSQYGTAIIYEDASHNTVDDVLNLGTAPTAGTTTEYNF
jgi:hypothetical protein